MRVATFFFFFLAGGLSLDAFSPTISNPTRGSSSSVLYAGGFGGGSGGTSANKVDKKGSLKQIKLKPKQQWDRFIALKGTTKIPVGVRMKEDNTEEWIKVGYVRSKEDAYTEVSVATQRALVAEHAKRLFPLQVSSKKTIEWAYLESEEWKVVDKAILETQSIPEGVEKMMGFEGTPDPNTGFYCIYDGGKLKLGEESSFS